MNGIFVSTKQGHELDREDPNPRGAVQESESDGGLYLGPADGSAETENLKVRQQWSWTFPLLRWLRRKRSDVQLGEVKKELPVKTKWTVIATEGAQ